jgi:ubiquinone/menaquinone biosynthesis C-methylase UbiE
MPKAKVNFVNVEWLKNLAQETKYIKQRSYQLMQIQPNSQILDVGCGPAIDTMPLSEFIGNTGRIVGVDYDPDMIDAANEQLLKSKTKKNIKHVIGDVFSLPFDDGEFDRVHLERFFQVFQKKSAEQIFGELNRVLAKNGKIVVVDMDMASLSVDFSDDEFERKLINHFALKMRPNGFAGRQLLDILKKNHYNDVKVELMHHSFGELTRSYFLNWITSGALGAKIIAQEEVDCWNEEQTRKIKDGTFLAYITNILVSGTKP